MNKKGKQKYKLGSIIAVPLPDGRFAFIKTFQEPDFGVYDLISPAILSVKEISRYPFSFFQASTDVAIKSGEWPVIGEEPFSDEDDSWIPRQATCYVRETNEWTMWETPHVNYKGQTLKATLEQVKGMDIMSVVTRPEFFVKIIVDRLINGNHEAYKVRSS